ncbi:MAG: hypothetical protein H7A37_10805 [Chlamydiales bacterium]|nr:hypothetical protein [Chlamydiia bacterium]MCP5508768.1 hypothetical protein [Chlamydiales bacterium]
MVKFIVNFVFFGLLFYAIYIFFPDAFEKLVSWVSALYNFLVDLVQSIVEKVSEMTKPAAQ